ncbi:MAG TPA: ATP-dependent DNA helicase RecG, partial [Clostridiales bacterium]|nr:ATP-dependent DNA helicase RecG [Clostridiales bacterium]
FPESLQALKEARYRLIFEELFLLQLGLLLIKNHYAREGKGIAFNAPISVNPLIESLPFQLTDAQKKVLREIQSDMESNKVMNRLVQGDVGSGKTVIALIALYKAVLNGYQGALMAPTEILAQQHFHSAQQWLAPLGVRIALLSGSLLKKEKEKVLHEIQNGKINLVIGTHALIQDTVCFKKLGLVVTDEQHRFGVRQRNLLAEKGHRPDVLVMTATPIPRTLALILYGDLDISVIDTLPPGRKKIKTRCISEKQRRQAYEFVRQQIQKGRQAYVIAPLIEDSEIIHAHSAMKLYDELKEKFFPDIRIALLHGKMKWDEKELVMRQFQSGEVQLLVSTTVVEVGVHVPNATVMLIENSERFGLAQLHQLRGRVGRGNEQSYCILVHNSSDPLTIQRLKTLEQVHDGFAVAEKDLELRGPGEFFGLRQHGLPEFKIANLFKHIKILKQAQKEAVHLIREDSNLSLDKNLLLKNKIMDQFGDLFDQIGL